LDPRGVDARPHHRIFSDLLPGIRCAVVGEEDTEQIMRGFILKDKRDGCVRDRVHNNNRKRRLKRGRK
jgi:hypothetical protein